MFPSSNVSEENFWCNKITLSFKTDKTDLSHASYVTLGKLFNLSKVFSVHKIGLITLHRNKAMHYPKSDSFLFGEDWLTTFPSLLCSECGVYDWIGQWNVDGRQITHLSAWSCSLNPPMLSFFPSHASFICSSVFHWKTSRSWRVEP